MNEKDLEAVMERSKNQPDSRTGLSLPFSEINLHDPLVRGFPLMRGDPLAQSRPPRRRGPHN